MKKNEILEDMILNLKDSISYERGKQVGAFLLGGALMVASIAAGKMIQPWIFEATRAFYALSTACPVLSAIVIAEKQKEINSMKREIDHINAIKKNGIKRSNIHHKKRIERINELENLQSKKKVPITINALLIIPCLIAWLGASAASFFLPEMLKIVAASVGGMALLGANAVRLEGKSQEYEARINNLYTDLDLENIFGRDVETKSKTQNSKEKAQERVTYQKERKEEKTSPTAQKRVQSESKTPSSTKTVRQDGVYHYNLRNNTGDIPKQKVKVR